MSETGAGMGQASCLFHFDNVFAKERFGGIDLYQFGEIFCERGYEIQRHDQKCLELSFIVSGSGYFYIDDVCVKVSEGDIIFNAVGHTHAIRTEASSMLRFAYMGFMFNEEADEEFADIYALFQSAPYLRAEDTHNLLIPFLRNVNEFYAQETHSRILIKSYLEQIIVLAYRCFTAKTEKVARFAATGGSKSAGGTVYAVMRYVEDRIFELKSIRSIADDLGYTHTYLSHMFKDKTGMTLQRYIANKKMEKALEILKYGNTPIHQVATMLQYETLQSFSKAFSRIMGCPPSYYAAQHRKEADPS